ncbi:hypothetical protein [Paraliobacillus sediminis]|uniref:hypothetical protein n=1 Tax=Paraliobacillus sediminis TaxID=1885916 RepID=UPI000E3BBF2F|nr:hypothetical protein [Paraliobacillus sediminis]
MFLVIGCFNWVGYHLTDALLVNGDKVVGIDYLDHTKKEELVLNIGRNSNFTFYETIDNSKLKRLDPKAIFVFDSTIDFNYKEFSNVRCFTCMHEKRARNNIIEITLPFLYGEWMERMEMGYHQDQAFIRFDSQLFSEDAVYVKDFVQALIQLVDASLLPDSIRYYTPEQAMKKSINKRELIILPSMSNEKRFKKVEVFYRKNSEFH